MTPRRPVLIMAGGTGGHIFPGLVLADEFRRRSVPVHWLGSVKGPERDLVVKAGFPFSGLAVEGLRGRGLARWLLSPASLCRAVFSAVTVMRRIRPGVVLGFGGFASGAGGIAAWLLRCPLVIHEQNAVAGFTNRMLSRLANCVLEAVPGSFARRVGARAVGNPVREELLHLPPPQVRFRDRQGPMRLLVVGGSQGAAIFNQTLPQAAARMRGALDIWHLAGRRHAEATRDAYRQAGIQNVRVEAFCDDMAQAYEWADLALARAGAITLAELAAVGLGAILIPFPAATDDHQSRNAGRYAEAGAAMVLPQPELSAARLTELLQQLSSDSEQRNRMALAARELARPAAAHAIAQAVLTAREGPR